MFTEIGIENFKAFGKMQRIPLKPITLLYGPNSSGKSSLMQALLLFKQTLEEAGDDKIVLLPKGSLVDLGGFQEFINGHDNKKDFSLSISFKFSWFFMIWYDDPWKQEGGADLSLEFSFSQDKKGEVLLKAIKVRESNHPEPIMTWKNVWAIPYLKRAIEKRRIEFEAEGDDKGTLNSWVSNLKSSVLVLDFINLSHKLTRHYWDGYAELRAVFRIKGKAEYCNPTAGAYKETEEQLKKLQKHIKEESKKIKEEYDNLNTIDQELTGKALEEKRGELKVRETQCKQSKKILKISRFIHHALMQGSFDGLMNIRQFPVDDRLISLINCFPLGTDGKGMFTGDEEWLFQGMPEFSELGRSIAERPSVYGLLQGITSLLPQAAQYFKEYLRRIVYIGPLREYPERVYSYSGNIPSSVGKSGKYTPDILMKRPDLVEKVNEWFDRFDIGYELSVDVLKRNLFALSLVDKKTKTEVSPKDAGFGIGQLLPILVQGILSQNKIICIEQPEIHVHPRLQAEMGSFFAEMAGRVATCSVEEDVEGPDEVKCGNQFIIETHSEHLILRLLRIIRETTNGELPKGQKPLRPEDVAVIYAKPTEHGTELMELRISEDGDFIDRWPDGFFTERAKELF